jgi:signal transduction histidine kinase
MLKEMAGKTTDLDAQNKGLEDQINRLSKVKLELEDLQKQKDDVFAMIIHDIKNPASLIKNLVDLLRGYDLNADETQEVMLDIVETTTKIVSLSQEFSRVMAMENVELQIDIMEADIRSIIEDVCRRNSSAAEKKGITIDHLVPDNCPSCAFDHNKMEEILDNLVSNAIKFSMSGTSVHVRVVPSKDTMTIEVHDSGLGMSEDDIKKAFRKGMKLSARPTAGENSSGLGLWIVKRLVEAHNGSVWVKSELNKGSIFGVVIPYNQ